MEDLIKRLPWSGMDTAPTDMTVVLGMDERERAYLTWWFAPSSQTFGWMKQGGKYWKPKWWVPLPADSPTAQRDAMQRAKLRARAQEG